MFSDTRKEQLTVERRLLEKEQKFREFFRLSRELFQVVLR